MKQLDQRSGEARARLARRSSGCRIAAVLCAAISVTLWTGFFCAGVYAPQMLLSMPEFAGAFGMEAADPADIRRRRPRNILSRVYPRAEAFERTLQAFRARALRARNAKAYRKADGGGRKGAWLTRTAQFIRIRRGFHSAKGISAKSCCQFALNVL